MINIFHGIIHVQYLFVVIGAVAAKNILVQGRYCKLHKVITCEN